MPATLNVNSGAGATLGLTDASVVLVDPASENDPVLLNVVPGGSSLAVVDAGVVLASASTPGPQGPPGASGSGAAELYDSVTPPAAPTFPYLRFERDVDGDVQAIHLGTAT